MKLKIKRVSLAKKNRLTMPRKCWLSDVPTNRALANMGIIPKGEYHKRVKPWNKYRTKKS